MERILRQFITLEFKEEAISLVINGGLSVSHQTLRNWIKKHNTTGLKTPGSRDMSELEAEVYRLRKELAEARLEKEILKKAMAYLAKEPRGGTR